MKNSYSILREHEYLLLSRLELDGAILDIGGNTVSEYHRLIKGAHAITTANINPRYGCDLVFDAEHPFPIQDEEYDHVIFFNVLEHLYNGRAAIGEIHRVLKKEGTLIGVVPFMHHIHGSPEDYHRYTRSALERMFKDSGFRETEITELGYGFFSLIFQTLSPLVPFFLKRAFVAADMTFLRMAGKYRKLRDRIPLGYFFIVKK